MCQLGLTVPLPAFLRSCKARSASVTLSAVGVCGRLGRAGGASSWFKASRNECVASVVGGGAGWKPRKAPGTPSACISVIHEADSNALGGVSARPGDGVNERSEPPGDAGTEHGASGGEGAGPRAVGDVGADCVSGGAGACGWVVGDEMFEVGACGGEGAGILLEGVVGAMEAFERLKGDEN